MDATNESSPVLNDEAAQPVGTRDGDTAADHDEPYRFGRRPTARTPYPFTERQYARLLILRSRLQDTDTALNQRAA